jgi:putative SOS response-associated peptidase YedK
LGILTNSAAKEVIFMCGRFTLRSPATVLIEHFDLDVRGDHQLPLFEPRYNIAPTQEVIVVRTDPEGSRRFACAMRWGLIPSWSKDAKGSSGPPTINARAETLIEKPMFRSAVRKRRCLIPADGFYEWQNTSDNRKSKKQPFFIRPPDGRPIAFAGLWETWKQAPSAAGTSSAQTDNSEAHPPLTIESCTIVTTTANNTLKELHDRMPVVLAPADYAEWLDPKIEDPAALVHLLAPCGDEELIAEPIGTCVNRVANDDPRCIEVQHTLF